MNEEIYFSRQTRLAEVGPQGQALLRQSRVLVVGAGGLGSPALIYLASGGIGTLGICDPDCIDASNLHRQILYRHDECGRPKATVAKQRLERLAPFTAIRTHSEAFSPDAADRLVRDYDLVLDGTDNFAAKFLIHDVCFRNRKRLVQAAIYRWEGQLQCFDFRSDAGRAGGCLRCIWPQMPEQDCVGACAEVGVMGVVAGVFGALQANEVIKLILERPESLAASGHTLFLDLLTLESGRLRRARDEHCPLCGRFPVEARPRPSVDWEIEGHAWLRQRPGAASRWVDIREPEERDPFSDAALSRLGVDRSRILRWPMSEYRGAYETMLDPKQDYLFFCARGARSRQVVQRLRACGFENVFSLKLGIRSAGERSAPAGCPDRTAVSSMD